MKKLTKLLSFFFILCAGFVVFLTSSSVRVHAEESTVVYAPATTTTATETGTAPTGSSYTFAQTASNLYQITSNNSMTLTLSGWYGKKITALTLSMKSNASKGTGSLSVTSGDTTIAEITNSTFKAWYGSYSSEYVDLNVSLAENDYTIHKDEDIVITIAATVNSLYCQSFSITYDDGTIVPTTGITLNQSSLDLVTGNNSTLSATVTPSNATDTLYAWGSSDTSVATVDSTGKVTAVAAGTATISAVSDYDNTVKGSCVVTVSDPSSEIYDFRALSLQEQLAFHYCYSAEYQAVTSLAEETYYLGIVSSGITRFISSVPSSNTMNVSTSLSSALSFTLVASGEYFLIQTGTKYIRNYSASSFTAVDTGSASIDDTYLWSLDSSGRIVNKSTSRYLGFTTDDLTAVRTYSTTNSYTAVTFLTTNGQVIFSDSNSTENNVTMRIGFSITKTLYDSLNALGTSVEYGLYLNNKTYVSCTPVEVDSTTYRFYVSVDGINLTNLSTVLTANGYVNIDGVYYYTTEANTHSVKTLAVDYLTNYADNDAVIEAQYALSYLAYNA